MRLPGCLPSSFTALSTLLLVALLLVSTAGRAQIAYRGAASVSSYGLGVQYLGAGSAANGTGATVTPGLPTRSAGDLLLTIIEAGDLNAITMPSPNWTLLASGSQSNLHQAAIYWRIATNTTADTATISHAAGPGTRDVLLARVVAFANVDPNNPFDGFALGSSNGTSATVSTGAITTTNSCSLLAATVHISDDNSISAPPTGANTWYQSFFSTTTTGNDAAIGLWYSRAGAAGAQPSVSITHSNSGGDDYSHAALLALRPAGLTVSVPAGTQAGDVMIATVATRPANTNPANNEATILCPPAGWIAVRDTINNTGGGTGGAGLRLQTYYRIATASEPSTYTWYAQLRNPSAAPSTLFISGVVGIVSYSGVDTNAPIDVEGGNTTGSSYSHTGNSITTTVADTMLVAGHAFLSADTWTPAAGMTERVDRSAPTSPPGNSVGVALQVSDQPRPVAGATGSKTAVAGGTSNEDYGAVHMLALRRAAVASAPAGFNAFETSTPSGAIAGVIRTKVAGSSFSLALVALNPARTAVLTGFTGSVVVELLDSSDNSGALDPASGCRSSWTTIQTLSPNPAFNSADNGRINVGFTVANAWRDVRVRVTYVGAGTVAGCSTDNFAIRPASFASLQALDANDSTAGLVRLLNNVAATSGVVHRAGRPFSILAQAVSATGAATAGYSGAPSLVASGCLQPAGCSAGALSSSLVGSGGAVTGTATHAEAGVITATLQDSGFAAVDAADSSLAERTISGALTIGRFVPDAYHLTVAAAPQFVAPLCAGGPARQLFSFVGQPFSFGTVPVVLATPLNAAGVALVNARPRYLAADVSNSVTASGAPVALAGTTSVAGIVHAAASTITFAAGSFSFARGTTPAASFVPTLSMTVNLADTTELGTAGNSTINALAPLTITPIDFAASAGAFHYGRVQLRPSYGDVRRELYVPLEVLRFNGLGWVALPEAGSCLAAPATSFAYGSATGLLTGGAGAPNCASRVASTVVTANGRAAIRLDKPGGVTTTEPSAMTMTMNLLATAAGTSCSGPTPTAATTINAPWLANPDGTNPSARLTWNRSRGELLGLRERFD